MDIWPVHQQMEPILLQIDANKLAFKQKRGLPQLPYISLKAGDVFRTIATHHIIMQPQNSQDTEICLSSILVQPMKDRSILRTTTSKYSTTAMSPLGDCKGMEV